MRNVVPAIIGVVAVIIILLLLVSYIADNMFERAVKKEVGEFFAGVEKDNELIQPADLEGLPAAVQKWMQYSQVVGKERVASTRSKQKAVMRLKAENSWMPVEAEQYFTAAEPGFIWKAKVKAAPFVHLAARDKYYQGRGNMLIKLQSLFKVADSRGTEIDQGSLLRFLGETVWTPTAVLSDYITWEEIDDYSARATMSYAGVTASGIFTINDKGEVTAFTAQRYGDFDGEFRLETWTIEMKDYEAFQGIRVPTRGEVTWELESGDFNWFQFEVTDIEYNNPVVYRD